jgi:hypothetical protein
MRRTTAFVISHRGPVLAVWLGLFVLGVGGAINVGSLLTNQFSVPGSDSQRGSQLLQHRFHERSDGAFTLVVQASGSPIPKAAVEAAAVRGASRLTN